MFIKTHGCFTMFYPYSLNRVEANIAKVRYFKNTARAIFLACIVLIVMSSKAHSQTTASLPAIISLLMDDGNRCITPISVGGVVFDNLAPVCEDQTIPAASRYFGFSHAGGPLHIDYISSFPNSFDTLLALREGAAVDGDFVASEANGTQDGQDDDGHSDSFGSRLIYSNLAAGRYTIEAKGKQVVPDSSTFQLSVYGTKVTATATRRLNDTGVEVAGISSTGNSAACDGSGDFAEQDCFFGRDNNPIVGLTDSTNTSNSNDGYSAFSFLKVSTSGAPLTEDVSNWSCVKDNVTGLLWEVKTDDNALHDKDHTYSWYNDDPSSNGGFTGVSNGGVCADGVNCDTQGFREAVNQAGLCGYNDWRLPTVVELQGIVNYNTLGPSIDTMFYPNTVSGTYWSSLPTNQPGVDASRTVNFNYGSTNFSNPDQTHAVRLVRSN